MTPTAPAIPPAEALVSAAQHGDEADWTRYVRARIARDASRRASGDVVESGTGEATGYHEWGWRRVFKRAFGHESVYLMARRAASPSHSSPGEAAGGRGAGGAGDIVGVLPMVFITHPIFGRSLTSMAFVNYGGVLAESAAVARLLIDAARDQARARRCGHVELRHIGRQFSDLPCRQHKVTMHLPLKTGMWDALDRKVRNQVRKAQKSELIAVRGGKELLGSFYTVFARNMRDLGTPVYSPRLFEAVLEEFPERAAIHVVSLGQKPVAAGFTFSTAGTTEVPWASSIRDYNSMCSNHLLYWNIIESAVERGAALLDFGRSTPNEGTFKFKEQWGASAVPLHWEYVQPVPGDLPNISAGSPKFHMLVEAWKRLPLGVATLAGPSIIKGTP